MGSPVVVLASRVLEPVYGQSCSASPQQIVVYRGHNTTITSPGYPSNYGDNLVCTWRFQTGSYLSDVVKVTFNEFQVGVNSFRSCYGDHLDFHDGDSTTSNLLGSYCGTLHPEVIYSTGLSLYVKFISGYFYNDKGFSFNVAAVAKDEAAGICRKTSGVSNDYVMPLSGPSGTILSPD
ncbi:bone morphogenetic protein 1-like [Stylophora pistillata]|uniref:bone morphogenetic protein 1-like n=1 Tax=Stylophora pistillata TaxID=50429 RepID=UPI000C0452DB|nr:bone morphogenetic protein 1-like [Stylophora pistillata]